MALMLKLKSSVWLLVFLSIIAVEVMASMMLKVNSRVCKVNNMLHRSLVSTAVIKLLFDYSRRAGREYMNGAADLCTISS